MKCGECPVATTNPKDKMDCYFCPFDKVDAFHSLHDCSHLSELVERMAELLKEREEFGEELNNAVELVRKKDEKVKELLKEQPQWIPAEERLPKSMINKVIVYVQHKDLASRIGFGHFEKYHGVGTWWDLERDEPFIKHGFTVTHWMPIPKSPYGEELILS